MPSREELIDLALADVGPYDPDRSWSLVCPELKGRPTTISWCGGWVLEKLHRAGLCSWPWVVGRGFLYGPEGLRLPIVESPELGDVAYFDKPLQHYAFVQRLTAGRLFTIDGNQKPGESVALRERPAKGVVYYSIAPLLRAPEHSIPIPAPPTIRRGTPNVGAVALMQERLVYNGAKLTIDGNWGARTSAALYEFQHSRGLETDLVCGPRTWQLLLKA